MDAYADVSAFYDDFERWLAAGPPELVNAVAPETSTSGQMAGMRDLMKALYSEGWSRYGWPVEMGGLGGTIYHRAAMWEALARSGVSKMGAFEHLEVLGPTLLSLGPAEFVSAVFPRFLDGTESWAQGFSEPDAGSDLASIRTRATAMDGGYVVTGRKIWTSWAHYATWCLLLVRTGTAESRHRGVTAMAVNLKSPGVEVRPIAQADGNDELAEVTFDDVFVPADRVIGAVDGGWAVAMDILSHERGTFPWFRHCFLTSQLQEEIEFAAPHADALLADAILDLASSGAASAAGLQSHNEDSPLGPRAAFTKLLLCSAEQSLYDWTIATDGDIAADPADSSAMETRQRYMFSRIVTIYGGSQQMQLDTIAKRILRLP